MSYDNNKPKKVFQNIGSGVLWKNKFKKTDKEPFFRGKATVRGHDVELAAWIKQDKNGQDMISIAIDDVIEDEIPPHQKKKAESQGLEELFGANDPVIPQRDKSGKIKRGKDGLPF
tara:strand:+ start:94 stop:441 length:348 start_codon:yes stop_codon:yes gene_type:complete